MPIKIKTDLEFGKVFYVKADPDQLEHLLVGVVFMPGNQCKFQLSYMGEVIEVWDFEVSDSRDMKKVLHVAPED